MLDKICRYILKNHEGMDEKLLILFQCRCNLGLYQHQPTLEKSEDEQSFEIEPSTMDSDQDESFGQR